MFGLFFQTLTPEQRASIRVVAGDGARWIDSCVHEWCPNAERAPDGFHIVSWTSDAPDNPRKQQKPLFFFSVIGWRCASIQNSDRNYKEHWYRCSWV